VTPLLAVVNSDTESSQRSDWMERDRALNLTPLLAGLRADELLRANVGDLRRAEGGAVSMSAAKTAVNPSSPQATWPSTVSTLRVHVHRMTGP
jgi:hypothetical protein